MWYMRKPLLPEFSYVGLEASLGGRGRALSYEAGDAICGLRGKEGGGAASSSDASGVYVDARGGDVATAAID